MSRLMAATDAGLKTDGTPHNVTPRRLREERVLHSPARYEAGESVPPALSWRPAGETDRQAIDPTRLCASETSRSTREVIALDCFSRS
jgi:hypothetical protein